MGANANAIGLASPVASFVWANPAGRVWLIVVLVVAEALNGAEDSVPVTLAVSDSVEPTAAVTAPVIVTVHT